MAARPEVLPIFGPVDRKSSLIAISDAIFAIEAATRFSYAQIGAELDVDRETVENAKYKNNLLNFVAIARMLGKWPEHCGAIRQLWEMRQVDGPTTPADDFADLHARLNVLEKRIAREGRES